CYGRLGQGSVGAMVEDRAANPSITVRAKRIEQDSAQSVVVERVEVAALGRVLTAPVAPCSGQVEAVDRGADDLGDDGCIVAVKESVADPCAVLVGLGVFVPPKRRAGRFGPVGDPDVSMAGPWRAEPLTTSIERPGLSDWVASDNRSAHVPYDH